MKMALCMARASNLDASAISPRQALNMATASEGLAIGQPADLAMVRLDSLWSAPVHDLDSALALCARATDVDALMVEGKFVMSSGELTMIDEEIILKESKRAVQLLRRRAGLDH
jgi:5-methylthioadenosine/S-adenosylhomocysteine deaminase